MRVLNTSILTDLYLSQRRTHKSNHKLSQQSKNVQNGHIFSSFFQCSVFRNQPWKPLYSIYEWSVNENGRIN